MEDFAVMAPEDPQAPQPPTDDPAATTVPETPTPATEGAPTPETPATTTGDGVHDPEDRTDPALDHDANPDDPPQPPTDDPAGDGSDSPTEAEVRLEQMRGEGGSDPVASAERAAERQNEEQAAELAAGTEGVTDAQRALIELAEKAPAGARAGHEANTPTIMGKMDNMSRRSDADALEGHFVTIDATADGVEEAYRAARLIRDEDDPRGAYTHRGFYGVYIAPAAVDPETGIPDVAIVRLRDDTNALVRVPYEALSPAQAGGR